MDWQPIGTAPKGKTVLVTWHTHPQYVVSASLAAGQWIVDLTATLINEPTHWMPLPEQPK